MPHFAKYGYKSYAMSLRGHGTSDGREKLNWTPLADFVSDVDQVIDQIGASPILIGHSMGGMIVQKYLETHRAPAAVLLASAPPKGLMSASMRTARRHPLTFLKVSMTMNLLHNIGEPELYREAFFSPGLPEDKLSSYYSRVQNESFRAYLDMMALDLPHPEKVTTPILVLGSTADTMFTTGEYMATAQTYNASAELLDGMGHAMMLDDGWQDVADRILEWLNEQGL